MKTGVFERELDDQPAAMDRALAAYAGPASPLKQLVGLAAKAPVTEAVFLGMGSSLFATYPATCWLAAHGFRARAVDASEFLYYYYEDPRPGLLPVFISQSGESAEAKRLSAMWKGKPFLAVTNTPDSTLAGAAAAVLPLFAGHEVTTTNKSYTNTIAVLLALSAALAGQDPAGMLAGARGVGAAMAAILKDWRARVEPLADFLCGKDLPAHLDVVGRGPSMASVMQGGLILRELSHTKIGFMNSGLFRHGLVPGMKAGGAMIAFAPAGATDAITIRLTDDVVAAGGRVLLVTNQPVAESAQRKVWKLPPIGELYAPMLEIMLIELLGIVLAERRGIDPGEGIAKITAVE